MKKFVDFIKRNLNDVAWILTYILIVTLVWVYGTGGLTFKIIYSIVCVIITAIEVDDIVKYEKILKTKNSKTTKGEDNV